MSVDNDVFRAAVLTRCWWRLGRVDEDTIVAAVFARWLGVLHGLRLRLRLWSSGGVQIGSGGSTFALFALLLLLFLLLVGVSDVVDFGSVEVSDI